MGVAVFNPSLFYARYPEFSAVSPSTLSALFSEAGLYLSNSDRSPVQNLIRRLMLLNMLTAHIGFLAGLLNAPASYSSATSLATSLEVDSVAPGPFTVPHGLGYVPSSLNIVPTSPGAIWADTAHYDPPYDGTYVYLGASDTGVTATIQLYTQTSGSTAITEARPVGRVSQASEGSVSASFEGVPPTPGTGEWFQQSQYGAAFWQATTNLRAFRYIPARPRY